MREEERLAKEVKRDKRGDERKRESGKRGEERE